MMCFIKRIENYDFLMKYLIDLNLELPFQLAVKTFEIAIYFSHCFLQTISYIPYMMALNIILGFAFV